MTTNSREAQKRQAAERAVERVRDGMRLGLGTGSTARHVLQVLAERQADGHLTRVVGVPTSTATAEQARALGITISTLDEMPELDLGIDGADEVDPNLNLIKGLGGALLWEKLVAVACREFVVVVDDSKLVPRLGARAPLPVEVVPFGWSTHLQPFRDLGAQPVLRRQADGKPFGTDGGHYIIDCSFDSGIPDARALQSEIKGRTGVIETGLFLDMTSAVMVAGAEGVYVLEQRP